MMLQREVVRMRKKWNRVVFTYSLNEILTNICIVVISFLLLFYLAIGIRDVYILSIILFGG